MKIWHFFPLPPPHVGAKKWEKKIIDMILRVATQTTGIRLQSAEKLAKSVFLHFFHLGPTLIAVEDEIYYIVMPGGGAVLKRNYLKTAKRYGLAVLTIRKSIKFSTIPIFAQKTPIGALVSPLRGFEDKSAIFCSGLI